MTNEEALKIALSSNPLNAGNKNGEYVKLIINALEWTTHTCEKCKYNETCKGVQIDDGNVIKFYGEDGYCAMWESDNQ